MEKKTLEEKIKYVCWWAFGLTLLYFLVGAWLISDGTKFDPAKTYNLLKDTLTLTAAFLAPVAAFVLFSDWRYQHNAVKNERISEEILKIFKEDLDYFYTLTKEDLNTSQKYNEYRVKFYSQINNLVNTINNIREFNDECREFSKNSKLIIIDLHDLWDNLAQQVFTSSQFEPIALNEDPLSKNKQKILIKMLSDKMLDNQKIYEQIKQKIKKLKPLKV
ncbi:hypothetical protein CDG60_09680 [Acinetobacter chinensis]|uniref:DUF4760 domain-containing protein n=1 Tax=Acinetobacter chinensis TaxID=2004650 RepID=A0A3B7LWM0_9GAMM|nr:hypothetical protein [Acinetobacter chinensis]AXY56811.1 hypothetical protein CDG60_09680 [Acinetobacter chinensis]